jgi:hypothetical protein
MATSASAARRESSRDFRPFCALLLCVVAALLGSVELVVRVGLPRISKIEGRIALEYRSALAIRHASGRSPNVLVVGNSWLLYGVDLPMLQTSLAPNYSVRRCVIEQTSYLDWYYGMRALYSRGARPDVVVLFLNATDMAVNDLRGDFFAYRMMLLRDVLRASRDAGLPPTQTFSLFLANFSYYYATRLETRKFLLSSLMPTFQTLRASIIPAARPPLDSASAVVTVAARLKQFDALVRTHAGRFIFVEAPTRRPRDESWALEAAAKSGVPVIVPMPAASLHDSDFREDQEHLNESGAARYTAALTPLLRRSLNPK